MLRIVNVSLAVTFVSLWVAREHNEAYASDNPHAKQMENYSVASQHLGPEKEPRITWNSARLLAIKGEYETILAELTKTSKGNPPGKAARILEDFLKKHLSEEDLRQLALSCAAVPVNKKDRDPFTNHLLSMMVVDFVRSGDRDSLLSLLSTRFVSRIGWCCDIELYVVDFGTKLTDPILILGEAYTRSRVSDVRHEIADVVRRAFTGLGVSGKDDAEFVNNAMTLYKKEKKQLIINPDYVYNAEMDGADYATTPLFKRSRGTP